MDKSKGKEYKVDVRGAEAGASRRKMSEKKKQV